MRAVVLVGGFGTRLRPLTERTPKQMLPVVDRPMIEWVAGWLARSGVEEMVLALGYRPEAFLDAYPDGRCAGVRLVYAVEPEPLDTAGAIRFAATDAGLHRSAEPFLVVNGDVITDLDVGALLSLHRRSGAEGTIALTPVEDPSRYGVVPVDPDGKVQAFIEKPPAAEAPSRWINAGTYVLEPSVLGRIPTGRKVSIERETFPAMVAEGCLFALEAGAYWIDAGTPASYLRAQLDVVARRDGDGSSWLAGDTNVAPTARVEASVVMAGATVGDGAAVVRSVLLPGAAVAEAASVTDSVLGWRAYVGTGATLGELCVLGEGTKVPAGTRLCGAVVPHSGT